ncbi:MAG: hypothetical protein IPH13_19355 [Planctomycetes bacterium]|nr:hypothetical protein [Planctomycetota bacterium]MCC7171505.1 hypothetical protein [Planctomycetota bacterium]
MTTFIVAMVVAILAALLAIPAVAGARCRAAAKAPPAGTPVAHRDVVRAQLLALPGDNGPIAVRPEGDTIVATWQLMGIPWATLSFRAKLRTTHALHLTIGDGVVEARMRVGSVAWETAAATWMPRAVVTWSAPRVPDFGDGSAAMPITPEGARPVAQLVAHVRDVVTRAGYRFEPRP